MIEIDITMVPHCDHPNCTMGQLAVDCPLCGKTFWTCDNWYDIEEIFQDESGSLKFKCDHCKKQFEAIWNDEDGWCLKTD